MSAGGGRLGPHAVGDAVVRACRLEIEALKPGNVGMHGDGHGMVAADFTASADAVRGPLSASGARVGRRILDAVAATREAVGCNTNLGIVLLCAPLAHAALTRDGPLRGGVASTLDALDREDASLAYRAIRLARPGGLGTATEHDVGAEPDVTLLEAMRSAADRDTIARLYATGYAELFDVALPRLRSARARLGDDAWAATACYLGWAGRNPDSLVARKRGMETAMRVQSLAAEWSARLEAVSDPRELVSPLLELDKDFKAHGINPGTSADLTVACLFADLLERCERAGPGTRRDAVGAQFS